MAWRAGRCPQSMLGSTYAGVDPNHIERDMITLMEAQRREFPQVGGFCELTSLTQHTVTQRILRRWPVLPSERREAGGPLTPPARAITYLRHHPETTDKFDEEYGEKGMAARILKQYGVAKGAMPEPEEPAAYLPAAVDVTALLHDSRYSAAFDRKYGEHGGENSSPVA